MSIMNMISTLMITISIMLAVAFYTMLERKILGYAQIRKGPNKVSMMGILQPFSDAMKLLTKSQQSMENTNFILNYSFPATALLISLILFPIIPIYKSSTLEIQFNTIIFLIISSLAVYIVMLIGWATNSKYSHLGSIRNVAQMISYEICFFMIILAILLPAHSFNINMMMLHQKFMWFMVGMIPLMFMWLISCTAEVNRSPFDFAEGESELVSGFNVEYAGGHFALIFLAEYASMILLSFLTSIMFFNNSHFIMIPSIMAFMFLWMRATLPRFRYDMLMNLNWKMFLPTVISIITPMSLFALM